MFNIQGSELIFLLLVALVILGPEKLPDAVRKFTKAYSEFKKMANGFQGEFRQVLDEPMRELRETANLVRDAAKFEIDPDNASSAPASQAAKPGVSEVTPRPTPISRREPGLNFGSANPRRQTRVARSDDPAGHDSAGHDTAGHGTDSDPSPPAVPAAEPAAAPEPAPKDDTE